MGKRTSKLRGNYSEDFIKNEFQFDRYNSTSSENLSVLQLLEQEEMKESELINALEEGEKSGFIENFDPKQNLTDLRLKRITCSNNQNQK